jgi:hypothetical protein
MNQSGQKQDIPPAAPAVAYSHEETQMQEWYYLLDRLTTLLSIDPKKFCAVAEHLIKSSLKRHADEATKELRAQLAAADAALKVCEAKELITRRDLELAVNASCTCGGKGPDDPQACPACMVWHRLTDGAKEPEGLRYACSAHYAARAGREGT